MKGLPRRARQLSSFVDTRRSRQSEISSQRVTKDKGGFKYKDRSSAPFKFETGIECFRNVIKKQNRNQKRQDSQLAAESYSGVICQEPQPQSPDRVFAFAALPLIALMAYSVGFAAGFPTPEVTRIKAVNPPQFKQFLLPPN